MRAGVCALLLTAAAAFAGVSEELEPPGGCRRAVAQQLLLLLLLLLLLPPALMALRGAWKRRLLVPLRGNQLGWPLARAAGAQHCGTTHGISHGCRSTSAGANVVLGHLRLAG